MLLHNPSPSSTRLFKQFSNTKKKNQITVIIKLELQSKPKHSEHESNFQPNDKQFQKSIYTNIFPNKSITKLISTSTKISKSMSPYIWKKAEQPKVTKDHHYHHLNLVLALPSPQNYCELHHIHKCRQLRTTALPHSMTAVHEPIIVLEPDSHSLLLTAPS